MKHRGVKYRRRWHRVTAKLAAAIALAHLAASSGGGIAWHGSGMAWREAAASASAWLACRAGINIASAAARNGGSAGASSNASSAPASQQRQQLAALRYLSYIVLRNDKRLARKSTARSSARVSRLIARGARRSRITRRACVATTNAQRLLRAP
jgi:hypothetical protein